MMSSPSELDSVSQHINFADSTLTSFLTLLDLAPYSMLYYIYLKRERTMLQNLKRSCFAGGFENSKILIYSIGNLNQ